MRPTALVLLVLFLALPATSIAQGINSPGINSPAPNAPIAPPGVPIRGPGGVPLSPLPAPNNPRFLIPFPRVTDPLHFNSNTIHPTMPWVGITNPNQVNYGAVVRSIEVPPQQVEIQVYVPGPGSFSGGYEQQVVEIPGYVVTETTTGYIYPERVGLQQVTLGVHQWVTLPQQFQSK